MDSMTNLLGVIIIFFVVMMIWRAQNLRKADKNIWCEFVTDEGTGYTEFNPVKEGILTIEPTKKRAGAEYPIGSVSTMLVNYPQSVAFFMKMIQVKARKVILDELTAEPILNRSPMLLLTPQRMFNQSRQQFTQLAVGRSVQEAKELGQQVKTSGSKGSSWMWWVLAALVGVGVAIFLLFQKSSEHDDALGTMRYIEMIMRLV